jgi:hypothetical protein
MLLSGGFPASAEGRHGMTSVISSRCHRLRDECCSLESAWNALDNSRVRAAPPQFGPMGLDGDGAAWLIAESSA